MIEKLRRSRSPSVSPSPPPQPPLPLQNSSPAYVNLKHWRNWKLLAFVGFLNGVFPVKNLYSSTSVADLEFRKLSFSYAFSLLAFAFKCVSLAYSIIWIRSANGSVKYEQTMTDIVTLGSTVLTSVAFGIFAHLLAFTTAKSFLEVTKLYYAFLVKLPSRSQKLHICYWPFLLNSLASLFATLSSPFMGWRLLRFGMGGVPPRSDVHVSFYGFELSPSFDSHLATLLIGMLLTSLNLEIPVVYVYGQLIAFSETIKSLLHNLTIEVRTKAQEQLVSVRGHPDMNPVPLPPPPPPPLSWTQLSELYLEFRRIFNKYEDHVAWKLIILYLALVIKTVSISYYLIRSDLPFVKEFWYLQTFHLIASLYRIYVLANTGEVIQRKYKLLLRAIVEITNHGQGGSGHVEVEADEKREFNKFLTIVQSTPMYLNAKGFFGVQRSNMISIFSVALTYIIVLLQFRQIDTTKYDSLGARTSTT